MILFLVHPKLSESQILEVICECGGRIHRPPHMFHVQSGKPTSSFVGIYQAIPW